MADLDRDGVLASLDVAQHHDAAAARHVFFQKEDADTYIGKILTKIAASIIAAPVSPSSS